MTLLNSAHAVDAALDALEAAAGEYTTKSHAANKAHMRANNYQSHPLYDGALDHIQYAIASRPDLAKWLGMVATNEPRTVAGRHGG